MTETKTPPAPIWTPSPNFNARAAGVALAYVVLHYTGMPSFDAALARLCDPDAAVSAHYVIDEAGQIFHLVADAHRAWHAGQSMWRGETDMNSASIGIELVNPGHEFGYKPFPAAQINSLIGLLGELYARHGFARDALVAHADIAPRRKADPGELFPWPLLAEHGFGVWPEEKDDEDDALCALTSDACAAALRAIGYDAPDEPDALHDAIVAFQRRYMPSDLRGRICARLERRIRQVSDANILRK